MNPPIALKFLSLILLILPAVSCNTPATAPAGPAVPAAPKSDPYGSTELKVYKVRTILPRFGPDGPIKRDFAGSQLPTYEAFVLMRLPNHIDKLDTADIKIDSALADSGERIVGFTVTPGWKGELGSGSTPQGFIPLTFSTRGTIPDDTAAITITGSLKPAASVNKLSSIAEATLTLNLGDKITAGATTLTLNGVTANAANKSVTLAFGHTGPIEQIQKIQFFDNKKNLLHTATVPRAARTFDWRITLPKYAEIMQCVVSYSPELEQVDIPFSITLPSLRPIDTAPKTATAPAFKPLQIVGVTLIEPFDALPPLIAPGNPAAAKQTPGITLTFDATSLDSHIAEVDPVLEINSWRQGGQSLQPLAKIPVRIIEQMRGFANLERKFPRSEVCLEAQINNVPGKNPEISGYVKLNVTGKKTFIFESKNVPLKKDSTFTVDTHTVIITGIGGELAGNNPNAAIVMGLDFPADLKPRVAGASVSLDGADITRSFEMPIVPYNGPPESSHRLSFFGKHPAADISVTVSDSLEEKRLPFSFRLGLGKD